MNLEELHALIPRPNPSTGEPQKAQHLFVDSSGDQHTLIITGVGIQADVGFGAARLDPGTVSNTQGVLMSIKPIPPPDFQQGGHLVISELDWELVHMFNDEDLNNRLEAFFADLTPYDPTAVVLSNGWNDDPLDMGRAVL